GLSRRGSRVRAPSAPPTLNQIAVNKNGRRKVAFLFSSVRFYRVHSLHQVAHLRASVRALPSFRQQASPLTFQNPHLSAGKSSGKIPFPAPAIRSPHLRAPARFFFSGFSPLLPSSIPRSMLCALRVIEACAAEKISDT
ncbi:MAG: hypothetical protein Q4D19_06840, partial [Lautropia sp.]|nr:hypothetical protein [Lautropia sp.]